MEWTSFKKYNDDMIKKIQNKTLAPDQKKIFDENIVHSANYILKLHNKLNTHADVILFIEELSKLPKNKIIDVLAKTLNIQNIYEIGIKNLFFMWKDFIEYFLNMMLVEYNNLCKKNNMQTYDTDHIYKELNSAFKEYNISTSSPILFFIGLPRKYDTGYSKITSIPKMVLAPSTAFPAGLNLALEKYNKYINGRTFEYLGFCNLAARERFKKLLSFELELVISVINNIAPLPKNVNFKDIIADMSDAIKKIYSSEEDDCTFSIREIKKFSKDTDQNIILMERINEFLNFYDSAYECLKRKEKKYIHMAHSIGDVVLILQSILHKL